MSQPKKAISNEHLIAGTISQFNYTLITHGHSSLFYYSKENGYTVLRLKPDRKVLPGLSQDRLGFTVGSLPELPPSEHLTLQGYWSTHAQYSTPFTFEICKQTLSDQGSSGLLW